MGKQKSATIEPLVKLRILDLYFGGKTAKEISRYLDIPFISVNRFIKHFNEYNQTFEIPITLSPREADSSGTPTLHARRASRIRSF